MRREMAHIYWKGSRMIRTLLVQVITSLLQSHVGSFIRTSVMRHRSDPIIVPLVIATSERFLLGLKQDNVPILARKPFDKALLATICFITIHKLLSHP